MVVAVAVLVVFLYLVNRYMNVSFFNGFLVAIGVFLSFDLLLVHWLMELHRVTSGPEATWIEVVLFLFGLGFVYVGYTREVSAKSDSQPEVVPR